MSDLDALVALLESQQARERGLADELLLCIAACRTLCKQDNLLVRCLNSITSDNAKKWEILVSTGWLVNYCEINGAFAPQIIRALFESIEKLTQNAELISLLVTYLYRVVHDMNRDEMVSLILEICCKNVRVYAINELNISEHQQKVHLLCIDLMHTLFSGEIIINNDNLLEELCNLVVLTEDNKKRNRITSRIVIPFLTNCTNSMSIDAILPVMFKLCSNVIGDSMVTSAVLSSMVTVHPIDIVSIYDSHMFWTFVRSFFTHSNEVVRKRGAYILQKLNAKSNLSAPSLSLGLSGNVFWYVDYLNIYQQIENCKSMHLMEQIMPLFIHLMGVVFNKSHLPSNDTVLSGTHVFTESIIADITLINDKPEIDFEWMKGLINIVMHLQVLSLKRLFLHQLCGGIIPLPVNNVTISYVVTCLLKGVANTSFFPMTYIVRNIDIGISLSPNDQSSTVSIDTITDVFKRYYIDVDVYPGVLIPLFIARLYVSYPRKDVLLRSLIYIICDENKGVDSVAATQWIVRTFADAKNFPNIVPCLTIDDIARIKAYTSRKIVNLHQNLLSHVIDGFLPIILSGCDMQSVGHVLFLELLVAHPITLHRIIKDDDFFRLFTTSLKCCVSARCINSTTSRANNAAKRMCDSRWVCLIHDFYTATGSDDTHLIELKTVCHDYLKQICNLMNTPYASSLYQEESLWFLEGMSQLVLVCFTTGRTSLITSTDLDVLAIHTISPLGADICSYIIANVTSVLSFTAFTFEHGVSPMFINTMELLDVSMQVIGSFFLLEKIKFNHAPNTHDLTTKLVLAVTGFIHFLTSIVSVEDKLDLSWSLKSILAVRCVAKLFQIVSYALPLTNCEANILNMFMLGVVELCSTVMKMHSISGSVYKAISERFDVEAGKYHTGRHKTVYYDFISKYGHFTRCTSMFYENKWATIASSLRIIAESSHALGYENYVYLLDLIQDQISTCTTTTLPSILKTCEFSLKHLLKYYNNDSLPDTLVQEVVGAFDSLWVEGIAATECVDLDTLSIFITLVFDSSILRLSDLFGGVLCRTYARLKELCIPHRPHVMRYLVLHLCNIWSSNPDYCILFFQDIEDLLLYREAPIDDDPLIIEKSHASMSRVMVLSFLESIPNAPNIDLDARSILLNNIDEMAKRLVHLSLSKTYSKPAMITSTLYGEKLRIWQALGVLSFIISEAAAESIVDNYFTILTHICVPSIRVHLEIFGAALVTRFTSVALPRVLRELANFSHVYQVLSSYFIILGHYVLQAISNNMDSLAPSAIIEIINILIPWLSCASGISRSTAQMIVIELIPHITKEMAGSLHMTYDALQKLRVFTHENKDARKMHTKNMNFFEEMKLSTRCSVKGLMSLNVDYYGELTTTHVLDGIIDALKAESLFSNDVVDVVTKSDDTAAIALDIFQTKRIPFNDLKLFVSDDLASKSRNLGTIQRQSVIVCASLVGKSTNLAGIARTCEIFAVEAMVVSNMAVVSTDEFLGISVNSDEWLPMIEVNTASLKDYLLSMKLSGYCIVGLEQTGSSEVLNEVVFPERCVLLLGREKEGIPADLLNIVDLCVEIPQYGVTRSLNVHVSAAITLWEMTKSNKRLLRSL